MRQQKKDKLSLIDLSTLVYGKVPPQAPEIERSLLGIAITNPESVNKITEILKPSDFYSSQNIQIANSIFSLYKKGELGILTLIEYLKENEILDIVGGPFYITSLTLGISVAAPIDKMCRIVKQKSIQRNLIKVAAIIINDAYEDSKDVFDLLSETKNVLNGISSEVEATNIKTIEDIAAGIITEYDRRAYYSQNNLDDPEAVYTGLKDWDSINGRLFNGVYVVASRPAMGKGVHMVENVCRMGKRVKVGVVNGEMTHTQLLTRIGCNLLEVDNQLWKKILITPQDQQLVKDCMQAAINIDLELTDHRDIDRIANTLMLWKQKGVKVAFADFLTAFSVPEEMARYMTPRQQVNYILATFVFLAKDLGMPIILYSQLNRENLKRKNGEPNLGDLKESGSIEELAFQVSFLHRPEYYDPAATEDEWGEDVRGLMYQIIAKHRDGITGRIKYKAKLNMSKLRDWDDLNSPVPDWNPAKIAVPFDPKSAAANDRFDSSEEFDEAAPF